LYNIIKNNHTYQKSFNTSNGNNDYFNLSNNSIIKKDIFNIKGEKPIKINNSNLEIISTLRNKPTTLIKNNYNEKSSLNSIMKSNINTKRYRNKEKNYYTLNKTNYEDNLFQGDNKRNVIKKMSTDSVLNNSNKFKKRDFNQNHAFHEIKTSKNKLISNSQSNYYSRDITLDELNISNNTNQYSINSEQKNKSDYKFAYTTKNIDLNNSLYKHKNFSNKSNSESYYSINANKINLNKNNNEKAHHKYYESKSIKNNESDRYTGKYIAYSSILNKANSKHKENNTKNINNKYFYQNWDVTNSYVLNNDNKLY
jgi:hypothetical protein